MVAKYKALIVGATGAASKRLVEVLAKEPEWEVVGVCRNPPGQVPDEKVHYAAADLTDGFALQAVVAAHPGITHVFYCCRARHGEIGVKSVADNVAMFEAVLDAVAETASLQHFHLVEGGMWYGMHLGSFPTPAQEDDPRHLPPNFLL